MSSLSAPADAQEDPARLHDPRVEQVLAEIHARYGALQSLRIRFEQRYVHRLHGQTRTSTGTLLIARPGRVRVDYDAPDERTAVFDGARWRSFVPDPAPGIFYEQESGDESSAILHAWLDPEVPLSRALAGRLIDVSRTGFVGALLELRPLAAMPSIDRILLYVDRSAERAGTVHRVMIVDPAGNTNRFDLLEVEVDLRIPPRAFELSPPRGALRVTP